MSDERHVQIQLRRGTAEEWANSSPQPGGEILAAGEPGFEKDTGRLKIGDGVKGWNELAYNTSSIVVEDIDKVVSDILVPGSGIAFDFNDSLNSLTISQNPIQTFANNSVLTSDGSSNGIVAEPNLLFDGIRMTIKCSCPTGSSGLTMVGDARSTQLRSNVYSDNYELETEDGIISLRNTSRMIFFGSRGTEATPTPLEVGDELFVIRGDGYNPHGTINATGKLDSRTSRISSSITNTGTHYLGSSIFLRTSSGGPTLWDNTLAFSHNGVLSVNNVSVSLDGHTHSSSDITDFNDAVTALVGESGGLTIESIQDNIANSFLVAGSNISLNYDDEADTLTISSTGGGGTELPYLELTNKPFIVLPAVLGEPVSFVRTADGNETDSIDEGLTLARGSDGALYNSETQEGYNNSTHAIDGAEWNGDGWGDLLNTEIRSYSTLRSVLNNRIGDNIVGSELIMHDTINDKYYKFLFSEWGQNNGGSFAYTRTLISDPNPNFFEKTDYGSEVDTFVEDSPEGSGVGITRGNNNGIYNPYQEEGWAEEVSPVGTEWNADGWDDLSDITSRTYSNFYNAVNGALGINIPGAKLVMRLTGTQTYYAIQFINWTQGGNGGGFSYLKYEINLDELQEGITFADGTTLKSAEGIGRVKSTASGDRRIEEVYGSKTVSVTEEGYIYLNSTTSRSETDTSIIYIDIEDQINNIANNYSDYVNTQSELEFSLDNSTWYAWTGAVSLPTNERGYFLQDNPTLTYSVGDPVYFRYLGGGRPVVWWNKNELPGGAANFRGAIIDYHAYTGEGTIIGTIHIVDDSGEQHISHTEVASGSTDSENDYLWLVENEGTISYYRIDGESKTLKVHWGAKVFYGSEYYD